jgi:hypothetical protein
MIKNLDLAISLKKKLESSGTDVQKLNKLIASGETQFGDADQNNYAIALETAGREYEKALMGPLSAGMLPVTAIQDGQKRFSTGLTTGQLEGMAETLKKDVENVSKSAAEQKTSLLQQLRSPVSGYRDQQQAPAASAKRPVSLDDLSQYAQKHQISVEEAKSFLSSQGYQVQ